MKIFFFPASVVEGREFCHFWYSLFLPNYGGALIRVVPLLWIIRYENIFLSRISGRGYKINPVCLCDHMCVCLSVRWHLQIHFIMTYGVMWYHAVTSRCHATSWCHITSWHYVMKSETKNWEGAPTLRCFHVSYFATEQININKDSVHCVLTF